MVFTTPPPATKPDDPSSVRSVLVGPASSGPSTVGALVELFPHWHIGQPYATAETGLPDEPARLGPVDRPPEPIQVDGHAVAPAELEAYLLTHAWVADAAVVAVPDGRNGGEAPKAFVVRAPDALAQDDDDVRDALLHHVETGLARHHWLRGGVDFVDAVPRTPSGKILRRLLREAEAEPEQGPRL